DFNHAQTGVAPNAIELHPVLGLCFGANCAIAGQNNFAISVTPASRSVSRAASTSYTIVTAVTSGSAVPVSLSITGLPSPLSPPSPPHSQPPRRALRSRAAQIRPFRFNPARPRGPAPPLSQ